MPDDDNNLSVIDEDELNEVNEQDVVDLITQSDNIDAKKDPFYAFKNLFDFRDLTKDEKAWRISCEYTMGGIRNPGSMLIYSQLYDTEHGGPKSFEAVKKGVELYDQANANYKKNHNIFARFFSHFGAFENIAKERETLERMQKVLSNQGLETSADIQAFRNKDLKDFPADVKQRRDEKAETRKDRLNYVKQSTKIFINSIENNNGPSFGTKELLENDYDKYKCVFIKDKINEARQKIASEIISKYGDKACEKITDPAELKRVDGQPLEQGEFENYTKLMDKALWTTKYLNVVYKHPNAIIVDGLKFYQANKDKDFNELKPDEYIIPSELSKEQEDKLYADYNAERNQKIDEKFAKEGESQVRDSLKRYVQFNALTHDEIEEIIEEKINYFNNPPQKKSEATKAKEQENVQKDLEAKTEAPEMDKNDPSKQSKSVDPTMQKGATVQTLEN